MLAQRLPAARGVFWLSAGFALYRRSQPLLTLLTMGYLLVVVAFGLIPLLGPFLLPLLLPTLTALVANGCRFLDVADGSRPPLPRALTSGLVEQQGALLRLGILHLAGTLAVLGIDTLIDAFQKLNPPIDLYIIGRSYDGEEERLKRLIVPHVRDRIHFLGFQSGQTLMRWIAEALFSVVPSRWYDNAPISTYESFMNGTPVLASRIGGIPEQVQDGVTGRLFEPDSSGDLAQKMGEMLSNRDQLAKMGIAGQDYVRKTLLIKDQMDGLMNLFENVVANYKRG